MPEQVEQRKVVQEDLDARVDALLREMEETSDRVVRRLREEESDDAPSLMDLAGPGERTGPGQGSESAVDAAARGEVRGSASARSGSSLMQDAAAELSTGGGSASVDSLDELLAAAAADVMAHEEDGGVGEDVGALDAAIAAGVGEMVGAGDEIGDPAVGRVRGEAVAGAPVVEVTPRSDAAGPVEVAAPVGPPNAPAATMAPAAAHPGLAQRLVDLFVHNVTGAAASARPHAIRFMWRLEQYTLGLTPGVRATVKLVALWTLINAAGAWVFVMMQTPEESPVVEGEAPTVISGAPSGSGEAR